MKVSLKSLPKSEVELTIEVPDASLESARAEAIKRFAKEVKIDGFRDGKAPEDKIIEKVGEKNIRVEALDIAIKLAYAKAVQKEKIAAISHPKIEVKSDKPLNFVARVAVLPEVELGDYKKIELKREEAKVEKKEIEAVVKDILRGNTEATVITDRAAQKGDRAEIDFSGFTPDGVALDNTASKNHPIVLGEGGFIPGFEEGVEGMKVAEEREHTVKFPADYHAKHLAGKDVKFKIKLHKVEELKEPKLDDEFAKKVSGGEKKTWSEVEQDIEKQLQARKEAGVNQKLESDLITELLKIAKVEVPESLVEEELEFMLKDLQQRLGSGGLEWSKYLEQSKKKEEDIRKEIRPEAEKRIKVRLILDKLVETEKIKVEEKEIEARVEAESARHPESQKKEVRTAFAAGTPNRLRLQHQLKVIKLMLELTNTLSK
ncbi:MAG: trigger factor [Patescibacteria group bacterium]